MAAPPIAIASTNAETKKFTSDDDDNTETALLMCAYILRARPETRRIRINTAGEIQGNEFFES